MKDISTMLLAIVLVAVSLISLLTANRSREATNSALTHNQERVSDLGLRFAFNKK
jgi:hypothetical protein